MFVAAVKRENGTRPTPTPDRGSHAVVPKEGAGILALGLDPPRAKLSYQGDAPAQTAAAVFCFPLNYANVLGLVAGGTDESVQ